MTSEIPSHHIKQSVCATRPPYREGRLPKAVKVYTINNESCYLLIQGVPSVGAIQELQKLCSSFGQVDQFNALDDYPTEDKYTEVYLVKYKKIQSARFAKRKLDDHSFFGGALHVCYAPEYESVAETRDKLQDRRKVIAAKTRQYAQDIGRQHTPINGDMQVSVIQVNNSVSNRAHDFVEREQPFHFQNNQLSSETSAAPPVIRELYNSAGATTASSGLPDVGSEKDTALQTFELLPPPKAEQGYQPHKGHNRNIYEFSRVRSAHATFPVGYDGRLMPSIINRSVEITSPLHNRPADVPHISKTLVLPSTEPSSHIVAASSPSIIVRDYNPPKSTPKFVPRQALKHKQEKSEPGAKSEAAVDPLDQEIRKNAFHLGDTQGPAVIPTRKRALTTAAQQSVNKTISEIRNKISKVITQNVQRQNDPT